MCARFGFQWPITLEKESNLIPRKGSRLQPNREALGYKAATAAAAKEWFYGHTINCVLKMEFGMAFGEISLSLSVSLSPSLSLSGMWYESLN